MTWYVWQCPACKGTLTLNYHATEEDFHRFKRCGCKGNGLYEWRENHNDADRVYFDRYTSKLEG